MLKTIGLVVLLTGLAATAGAAPSRCEKPSKRETAREKEKACVTAPEIDPSSAIAGLTLLAGGVAVMMSRRTRRLQT